MGNYVNYQSVIDQLQAFGLMVNTLEVGRTTTKRVPVDTAKCPVDKEKRKSAGWYKLNAFSIDGNTYIVGSFGYWKGSDNNAVKVEWKKEWSDSLTPEQRQAMADAHKASIKLAEAERKREIEYCANTAQTNWLKLKTEGDSGYLAKKQVGAFGIKFHPKKDLIAVPVTDTKGKLFALQLIRSGLPADSKIPSKQFWPRGAEIKGHFHKLGNLAGAKVIFIAEGYATGASIHTAINAPVVVAFNANNLTPVAKEIAKANKYAKIVICADDDYLTDGNPGVTQAQNAALSVGGEWIKPDFMVAGTDIRNGEKLTDFNDLHVHPQGGLHLVTAQLAQYLTGAQPKPDTATSAGGDKRGEGFDDWQARSVMSLDEIANRYILVEDGTGKTVFDRWSRNFVLTSMVERQMDADTRWKDLKNHAVWASRALKKSQIAFDPTCKDTTIVENRWTGWPIKNPNHENPEPKCTNALHLLYWLTSREDETKQLFGWVIKWLAYPIQNPGAKMDSCLVFKGAQGTGKGFLFNQIFGALYGEFFAALTQSALEDKFNSDWSDRKLFIVADEVVASSEKYRYKNQLKTLISEPFIRVNPKNMSAYQERNHFNLVFLSNEAVPVILENDDRRHCVIETPEALPQDFYYKLQEEVEAGGVAALYQFLLELDLGDFNERTKPPMTSSKSELIDLGLDSHERFIKQWVAGETVLPVCPVSKANFYKAYIKWCASEGEHYRHPAKDLRPVLRKYFVEEKVVDIYGNYLYTENTKKSTRIYEPMEKVFIDLDKKGKKSMRQPKDKTLAQWRTDGNMDFLTALDEEL